MADDYWSLHSEQNNLEQDRIHQFGVDGANDILYSPDVIHAVFIRDCIERALSAFLDKCIGSHWGKKYWCTPRTDDNNRIAHKVYSHFDLYIDAIVDRPDRYQLDYHWLPQNFVCDLYKFAGRYHVYYSRDIRSRYDFLMDIGGQRTWNEIGANGWVKKDISKNADYQTEQRKRRLGVYVNGNIHESEDSNENITEKKHKVKIMGKEAAFQMEQLDLSGSFLDKESYHSINASQRLVQFYRADSLAKVIVFYESDYVLFNMTLPSWICKYLCVYDVIGWLLTVDNGASDHHEVDGKSLMDIEGLGFGKYSVYFEDYDHEQVVVDRENRTWTREIEMERRRKKYSTLIPMFESMRIFDRAKGTIIHRIRGLVALSNVLSFVDHKILPQCWKDKMTRNLEEKIDFAKSRERDKDAMIQVIGHYFNGYLKAKGVQLIKRMVQLEEGTETIDAKGTFVRWENEDKILYHNIGQNLLWMREAPRRFWTHQLGRE